jgi:chromosome segregation ATPase
MKNIEKESEKYLPEPGFISLIFEYLKLIFKLSLINFEKKNSKFTLKKNFDNFFEQKIKEDKKSFTNFICNISDELKNINEFLQVNSKDKDFKAKDLNLDILMSSINNCYLFCVNKMSREDLINELKNCFNILVNRKKIQTNKESKAIISEFHSNIDNYENYLNELIGEKSSNKLEEKKEVINEEYYREIIDKLRKEINDYKAVIDKKDIEIKEVNDKNKELSISLSETKIQSALDNSNFEELKKDFSNKFTSILFEHSKQIKCLNSKIENLEEQIKDLKNENKCLKLKLALSEKKIEILLCLINTIRKDMNRLAEVGKGIVKSLDETSTLLIDVKYILDKYDIELDNLGHIIQ